MLKWCSLAVNKFVTIYPGVPCTDGDFFKVNVTDVGVGGCAVHQVQLRNSSTQCLTGKNYKQVVDIRYDNCMCRRRHYQWLVLYGVF